MSQYPFSLDDTAADHSEALGVRMSPVPHHDGESFAGGDVLEMAKSRAGASFHLGAASGMKGGGDELEASDYFSARESHSPAGVSARAVQSESANEGTLIRKSVADWASIIVQEPGNQRYRPTPWAVDANEYVKHFKGTTFIAIGAIAKKVAQQEAKVFRRIRRKSGVSKEAVSWDHPLVQLFEQVNPIHTQFDLWYQMVAWRLLTGNSYWWKARNAFGKPAELWPLPSQWVWAIPSSKEFIAEYLVRGVFGGVDRYIKANDVLHIREMSIDWNGPGRFYGTPMAAAGATAIDLEEAMLQRLYYQFKNFNPPGMQYSTDEQLTQEQFMDMMLQIRMQQHTAEQTGAPILTHSGVKAQEFKNTVREMDYSNSLQTIMSYILAMFGTPQAVVGVSRDYSRANLVGALLAWSENTINPLLRHLGQHLTQGLAKDYDNDLLIEFDPVEVADSDGLRADVQACVSAGAMTPNEVRESLMKKAPFVGGGDKPYKPAGLEEAAYGNPKVDEGEDGDGSDDLGELASGEEGVGVDGGSEGQGSGLDENGNPIPPAGQTPSVDPFTGLESTGEFSGGDAGGESGASGEIQGGENAATGDNEAKASFRTDSEAVADTSYEGPSSQVDLLQDDEETPDSQPLQLNGPDGVSAEETADATGFTADEIPDEFDGGETPEDDVTPKGADSGVDVPDEFKPTVPRGNGKGTAFSLGGGLGDRGGDNAASGEDEGEGEEEFDANPFSRYAPKNAQSVDVDNIDMLLSDDDDGESQRSEVGVEDLDLLLAGEDEEPESDTEGDDENDSTPPAKLPPKKPKPLPPAGKKKLAKAKDGGNPPRPVKISRSPAEIASARNRLKNWLAVHSQQENQAASDFARFFDAQANRIAAKLSAMIDRGEPINASTAAIVIDWKLEDERLHDFASRIVRGTMDAGFKFAAKRGVELANERRIRREKLGIAGKVTTQKSLSLPLAKAPSGKQPFSSDIYDFLIDIPDDAREAAEDILADSLSMPYWSKVNQTTMATMETVINEGIDAYQSAQAIAAKISERLGPAFNRKRAMTIARTEITTALNTAQITIMREVNNSPEMEPFALEWLSGDDHLTRPSHVKAHGQIVAMGELFQVGNERCHYPGELTLSAKERINCRCAFVEVFVEDLPEGHPVRVKLEAAAENKGVELVGLEPDMWTGVTGGREWTHAGGLGAETDWRMAKRRIEIEKSGSGNSQDSTYTPPAGARGNARKVLQWKEKYGREVKGMTSVGWGRSRQLASGKEISLSTVRRMSGFNRHRKNYAAARAKQKREGGKPWEYAGIVAWLGWGGSTGMAWAKEVSGRDVKKMASGEGDVWQVEQDQDSFASRWLADYVEVLKRFNKDQPRDKNGRFTHAGSAGASAAAKEKYKPSELVAAKMEDMRFVEHGRAAEVVAQMKSEKNKKAAEDYQSAYDAGYREAAKVRRKMLAKAYYENKKQEKWKAKREAAIEAANKASNDYSAALDKFKDEHEKEHGQSSTISTWEAWSASGQRETLIQDLRKKQAIAESVDKKWREVASSSADKVVSVLGAPPESRLGITHRMAGREDVKASKAALNRAYASRVKAGNKKELAGKAAESEKFLGAILAKESDNSTSKDIKVFGLSARGSQRAFAYERGVYLSSRNDVGTFVHEMGHVLESDPGFAALAQGFLVKRCGDEKPHVMRRDKRGNPEWGREDDFTKVFGDNAGYVGRHYPHASTEIFSMGLEQLYRDPVKFAKNDPEYFNFVVGAMRGHIKAKAASGVV